VQVSDEEFVRAAALAQLDTLVSTPIASAAVMPPTARVELPKPAVEPHVDAAPPTEVVEDVDTPAAEPLVTPEPDDSYDPVDRADRVDQVDRVDAAGAAAQALAEEKQDDVLARVAAYSRITVPHPDSVTEPEQVEEHDTVEEHLAEAPDRVEDPSVEVAEDAVAHQREARIAHRAVAAAEARARVADTVAAEQAELARQAAEERDAAAARLAELEAAVDTHSQALERAEADRDAAAQAERRQREIAAAAEEAAAEAAADADERVAAAEAAAEAAAREAAETVLALRQELAMARGEEPPAATVLPAAPVPSPEAAEDSVPDEIVGEDVGAEEIVADDTVAEDIAEELAAESVAAEVSVEELEVEAVTLDDGSAVDVDLPAEADVAVDADDETSPTSEDDSPGLEARRPGAPHTSTTVGDDAVIDDPEPEPADETSPTSEDESPGLEARRPGAPHTSTSVEQEEVDAEATSTSVEDDDAEARAARLTVRPSDLLPDHGPAVVAGPATALSRAWRRVRGAQESNEADTPTEVVVPPVPALGSRGLEARRPEAPHTSTTVGDDAVIDDPEPEPADETSPTSEDESPGLEARLPEAPHTSTSVEEANAEESPTPQDPSPDPTTVEEADAEEPTTPHDASPGLEARRPGAPRTSTTVENDAPEPEPETVTDSTPGREALAALPAHVVRAATVSGATHEPYSARRRGGSGFVGALLAVAGVAAIVTLAIDGTLDVPLGVGLGVASFLAALFAYRRIGRSSRVTLTEEGVLTLVFGDAHHSFDLSTDATDLEMVGSPGDAKWAIRLLRRGLSPLEVDAGSVDPMLFTEALRQWRPDL